MPTGLFLDHLQRYCPPGTMAEAVCAEVRTSTHLQAPEAWGVVYEMYRINSAIGPDYYAGELEVNPKEFKLAMEYNKRVKI